MRKAHCGRHASCHSMPIAAGGSHSSRSLDASLRSLANLCISDVLHLPVRMSTVYSIQKLSENSWCEIQSCLFFPPSFPLSQTFTLLQAWGIMWSNWRFSCRDCGCWRLEVGYIAATGGWMSRSCRQLRPPGIFHLCVESCGMRGAICWFEDEFCVNLHTTIRIV